MQRIVVIGGGFAGLWSAVGAARKLDELGASDPNRSKSILDLGPWGALYTQGWDRAVRVTGAAAKRTRQEINCVRIYPPLTGDRRAILDAAAPVVQAAPRVVG